MSEHVTLSILHHHRTITLHRSSYTLVQSVLEAAVAELRLSDPSALRLVTEKGQKALDHSLSLKLAGVRSGTKLAIVKSATQ